MRLKLNIRTKLIGAFLLVTALLLAVFGVGLNGLNALGSANDQIVHEALPENEAVAHIELLITEQEAFFYEYALTLDPAALQRAEQLTGEVDHAFGELRALLGAGDTLIDDLRVVDEEYLQFVATGEAMGVAYAAGNTEHGSELAHELESEVAEMETQLGEVIHAIDLRAEQAFEDAASAKSSATTMMVSLAVIAALVPAATAWL
ncbi:MAG: MCP four helix bundle domain-containing protein, partial [Chloroflexi bacterium]|nr:MCP four helix bundle domain-containing protein [Chloroflexota bacterium]